MEGFDMFDNMNAMIREDTVRYVLNVEFKRQEEQPIQRKQVVDIEKINEREIPDSPGGAKTPVKVGKKVGRNEKCPCGSNKKYKDCCGRKR